MGSSFINLSHHKPGKSTSKIETEDSSHDSTIYLILFHNCRLISEWEHSEPLSYCQDFLHWSVQALETIGSLQVADWFFLDDISVSAGFEFWGFFNWRELVNMINNINGEENSVKCLLMQYGATTLAELEMG